MFTGWLSDRYPLRILVLIGAIGAMIGFVMSAFASNIYIVIIGYGVITGLIIYCIGLRLSDYRIKQMPIHISCSRDVLFLMATS